jgi:hypothetical protein
MDTMGLRQHHNRNNPYICPGSEYTGIPTKQPTRVTTRDDREPIHSELRNGGQCDHPRFQWSDRHGCSEFRSLQHDNRYSVYEGQ